MTSLIRNLVDYYNYLLHEKAESRIVDMPLMSSPLPIIFIISLYLHFIKISGPKFLEKRKPFELKNVMILNNAAQCFVNFWCCWQGIMLLLSPQYNFKCTVMAPTTGPHELQEIWLSWFYLMVKVWDLSDTIFMVLRKNYHQVTFLHVYHHIGMVMGGWIVVRYLPGGHLSLVGTINCFVHTIMYFYYLLTAYNPQLKKSIWWKKHITELQMVQFTIILVHHSWAFFDASCKYPKIPLAIFMSQNFFIIYLFSQFYYNSYIKDKNEKNRSFKPPTLRKGCCGIGLKKSCWIAITFSFMFDIAAACVYITTGPVACQGRTDSDNLAEISQLSMDLLTIPPLSVAIYKEKWSWVKVWLWSSAILFLTDLLQTFFGLLALAYNEDNLFRVYCLILFYSHMKKEKQLAEEHGFKMKKEALESAKKQCEKTDEENIMDTHL